METTNDLMWDYYKALRTSGMSREDAWAAVEDAAGVPV